MALDKGQILVGAPDQKTTGAILSAPLGTVVPTKVDDELDGLFVDSGYISEDGLTMTPERSTEKIKDWNLEVVRELLTEFSNKMAWTHLQTSEGALKNYFGEENVELTPATTSVGSKIVAKLTAKELPRKVWVFRIKDGDNRVLIVVPEGQITEVGEVPFKKGEAIKWPVTMTTYPDDDGVHAYIYFEDGQKLEAGGGE